MYHICYFDRFSFDEFLEKKNSAALFLEGSQQNFSSPTNLSNASSWKVKITNTYDIFRNSPNELKNWSLQQHYVCKGAKKIGRCWKVMVGFENGVFQVECLAMIADPMGTLSKLLKCDSFLRPVFQLEVGKK